jgi:hypothetical protein
MMSFKPWHGTAAHAALAERLDIRDSRRLLDDPGFASARQRKPMLGFEPLSSWLQVTLTIGPDQSVGRSGCCVARGKAASQKTETANRGPG